MPDSYWVGLAIERLEKLLFDNVASKCMSTDVQRVLDSERTRLIERFAAMCASEHAECVARLPVTL